jgi:hypothetical protein
MVLIALDFRDDSFHTFFFDDLEPTVADEARPGTYGWLFYSDNLMGT